jgi:hypothetical protein
MHNMEYLLGVMLPYLMYTYISIIFILETIYFMTFSSYLAYKVYVDCK